MKEKKQNPEEENILHNKWMTKHDVEKRWNNLVKAELF